MGSQREKRAGQTDPELTGRATEVVLVAVVAEARVREVDVGSPVLPGIRKRCLSIFKEKQ